MGTPKTVPLVFINPHLGRMDKGGGVKWVAWVEDSKFRVVGLQWIALVILHGVKHATRSWTRGSTWLISRVISGGGL